MVAVKIYTRVTRFLVESNLSVRKFPVLAITDGVVHKDFDLTHVWNERRTIGEGSESFSEPD